MRFNTVLFYLFVLPLLLSSCNEDDKPTGPGPTTPDTTSHDFVWDITQIGVRHTALYDVEAISDTDVWICGEIHFPDTYQNDSLGNIIKPFNLAHWNGMDWTYHRIRWDVDGPFGFRAVSAVKAFSANDIWFSANGGAVAHWDGISFRYWLPDPGTLPGAMPLLEGTPGHLYMAGPKGAMMHFDGDKHFTSVYSGTNLDINDMWTSNGLIMALANDYIDINAKPVLITIENGKIAITIDTVKPPPVGARSKIDGTCLWFIDKNHLWIAGPGISSYTDGVWSYYNPDDRLSWCIRGQAENDVFVAGHGAHIHHFNGKSWKYIDTYATEEYFKLDAMSYAKDNVWISGGGEGGNFFIIHGKRRNP